MQRTWKRAVSVLLAVLLLFGAAPAAGIADMLSVTASAESIGGNCGADVTWALDTETGVLTISGTGEMGNYWSDGAPWPVYYVKAVTIRNGVTSIGSSAFYRCTNLTSITIPDSVTSIGSSAFYRCTNLASITIPDSVTSIGYGAFDNCWNLTNVTIPDSVTSIDERAFFHCTRLTSITVDPDNPAYSSDANGILYNKDKTTLIQYPAGNARTTFTIPDSVTSIGDEAFCYTNLTSVTIGNSVTSIGYAAFEYCTSLTSVIIGNSVTDIGNYAFKSCTSLASITIPDGVTNIGIEAFHDTAYYNNDDNWLNDVLYIGHHLIGAKESLSGAYTIADGTMCIGGGVFAGWSLTSVTIPDSVTSIGNMAFRECMNLTSVTIPDSVTCIGDKTFQECTSLTSVTIGNGVTSIGDGAFAYCTSLTSVTIPDSVTSIGKIAFYYCSSLTSVTIPDSVTSIDECAFMYCTSLTSVTIPDSVTSIGEGAFWLHLDPEELESFRQEYDDAVLNGETQAWGFPLDVVKMILDHPNGSLADVYYRGTQEQWDAITIGPDNEDLLNATLHCLGDVPPCAHVYNAVVTSEATCTAEGVMTYTCTVCGDSYTETIAKADHTPGTPTKENETPVTCTKAGRYEEVVCCSVCGTELSRKTIETLALGHSFTNYVYNNDATTEQDGTKSAKCDRCDVTNTVSAPGTKILPPTVAIKNFTANQTVEYRSTVTFAAVVTNPSGGMVHWFIDGKDAGTGETYTAKEVKEKLIVQAKYMQDGKVLAESETETVKVNSGFFAKLKAFFRALFGRLPVIVQEYLGVEFIDRLA